MVQAEGVYNQRLQNLALTLDKVGAFHFFVELSYFSFVFFEMLHLLSINTIGC